MLQIQPKLGGLYLYYGYNKQVELFDKWASEKSKEI